MFRDAYFALQGCEKEDDYKSFFLIPNIFFLLILNCKKCELKVFLKSGICNQG